MEQAAGVAPDAEAIRGFLTWWFTGCTTGNIEIAWSSRDTNYEVRSASNFPLSDIDGAVKHAIALNKIPDTNVYYCASTVNCGFHRRSSDADFAQAPGAWIDADTHEQMQRVELAKTSSLIRPTLSIITGTVPTLREQSLFKTDLPLTDIAQVRETNAKLAAYYGTDGAVKNPTSLMRLPGTINWPTPKKLLKEPSRRPELVIWKHTGGGAQVIPSRLLPSQVPDVEALINGPPPPSASNRLNVSECIASIAAGNSWHDNVVRLVAHKVALGEPDAEIMLIAPAITLPGYSVEDTEADLEKMIEGARKKHLGQADETLRDKYSEVQSALAGVPLPQDQTPQDDFGPLVPITMGEMRRRYAAKPAALIEGVLFESCTTMIVGIPGAGKSPLIQHMIACMTLGLNWAGFPTRQSTSLVIAAESKHQTAVNIPYFAYEELKTYYQMSGMEPPPEEDIYKLIDDRMFCLDVAFVLETDTPRLIAGIKVAFGDKDPDTITFDTVRSSTVGSTNKDEDMALVQAAVLKLRNAFPKAGIILIHHSPKGDPEGTSGSNRLDGMSDVIMAVVPISRTAATDDDSFVKRPDRYGPDSEGWHHYHTRIVTIRNKVWQPAPTLRMLVSAREGTARISVGGGAEQEMKKLRTVPPHTPGGQPEDESEGFADDKAKPLSPEVVQEIHELILRVLEMNSTVKLSTADIAKAMMAFPDVSESVRTELNTGAQFHRKLNRLATTLLRQHRIVSSKVGNSVLFWAAPPL
jgi:hypothetical protein